LRLTIKALYYFILDILLLLLDFLHILNINKRIYRSIILFSNFDSLFFLNTYNLEYINNKVKLYVLSFVYYIFNSCYCIKYIVEYSIVWLLGRVEHFFLNSTHPLGPRRVGPGSRRELDPRVEFRRANVKNPS